MCPGNIGQITSWEEGLRKHHGYNGLWVIATLNNCLMAFADDRFPTCWDRSRMADSCRVRLMESGEEITIKCVS